MTIDMEDFIEHFGVKGMKWGVRNEDDPSGKNSNKAQSKSKSNNRAEVKKAEREKKAKVFDDEAARYQKEIDELNKNYKPGAAYLKTMHNNRINALESQKRRALADAEQVRKNGLTTHQKKVLKGVAITAGILAAYGTYQVIQSGELHRQITRGKAFLDGNGVKSWVKRPELAAKDMSADDIMNNVVRQINPDFHTPGGKMNCRRCTFAYEMRRRGNDVAATRTTNGRGQDFSGLYNALHPDKDNFVNPKTGVFARVGGELLKRKVKPGSETPFLNEIQAASTNKMGRYTIHPGNSGLSEGIFNHIASRNPDRARGELGVQWGLGGGHSMAWEVINGNTHVFDTQSGRRYSTPKELEAEFAKCGGIASAAYTRLDNVDLNQNFLMRWLKDG